MTLKDDSIETLLDYYDSVETPTPDMVADPVWRLCCGHIYKIRSEDGEPISFVPTLPQLKIIEAVYIKGWRTIVVPKARQVRVSTVLALICLDWILFSTSAQVSLADIDIPAAQRKLDEKLYYAYERLPEQFKRLWDVKKKMSPGTLTVHHKVNKADDPNAKSVFYAGQRARGGTNQILWMSEWAELASKRPAESSEHLRGAWPAAARGIRIIESTWYGGQSGDVWGIAKKGLDEVTKLPLAEDKCSELTPRILFFPWYVIPERRLECRPEQIKQETREYFADIEKQTGDKLDDAQMYWYQEEMSQYGYDGRYIYPSIIHECWDSRIEGAVWGDALSLARTEGRVCSVPHDPEYETDTFWDLGAPENQPCLYVQHKFSQRYFIDCDAELKGAEGLLAARITRMKDKGYKYGTHYLPHDAAARQKNGISFSQEFEEELARQNVSGRVVILKVTPNSNLRRTHFEGLLRSCIYVDEDKCKKALESWQAYRYKPDPSREGRFLDDVVPDWSNHICVDGDTVITTTDGDILIRELTNNHKVKIGPIEAEIEWVGPTKIGPCVKVIFDDGSFLIASPEHKVFTHKGLVRCDALSYFDEVCTPNHPRLQELCAKRLMVRDSFWTRPSSLMAYSTTWIKKLAITAIQAAGYTKLFGAFIMERFLEECVFITKMKTKPTITLRIWQCFPVPSTCLTMLKKANGIYQAEAQGFLCKIKTKPELGMPVKKAIYGIRSMLNRLFTSQKIKNVLNANSPLKQTGQHNNIVQNGATRDLLKDSERMMLKQEAAQFAPHHLLAEGKKSENTAPKNATSSRYVIKLMPVEGVRQLYDMTVKGHHAYVANGVLVSNCDAGGYLSEAILAGHVPHSSNGIMTNLYFDAPYIRQLTQSMPEHRFGTWAIEYQGNKDFGRITARRDDTGGWLRIWEDPVVGRSYIVSLTLGAVAVWRASFWDAASGREVPSMLVAACVDEQGIHTSNLYKWASMASTHYGDAPITADITSLPGAVEAMRLLGSSVMARRQSASDRRIGQQSQEQRKPGHDFKADERLEAYSIMQALMRDQQAAIYCPVTLRQLQSIIIGDAGTPDLIDGAKEHWVKAHALALWNIGQANIMRRQQTSSGPVDYAGGQRNGGGSGRRKLA